MSKWGILKWFPMIWKDHNQLAKWSKKHHTNQEEKQSDIQYGKMQSWKDKMDDQNVMC